MAGMAMSEMIEIIKEAPWYVHALFAFWLLSIAAILIWVKS
jgi:hypothetical protein